MESEHLEPDKKLENNQTGKQNNPPDSQSNSATGKDKQPGKKKHFNVLQKDGSLADMPYNNEPGGGALEGTVGIGT